MRAMVCLPTYNERENLEPMVRALGEHLDTTRDRVLVLDDNSPDGTGQIADALAAELPWVEVLHRPGKAGLGPAYHRRVPAGARGGRGARARDRLRLLPRPGDVPRLIAACEAGADVALGSRWVPGGGTVNWGRGRTLVSRGGSLYARMILGVGVRDLTGGFKCFRRAVLEQIDLDAIAAKGYGFQIETTYRALRAGFTVTEIPITFVDRRVGESKMDGSIVVEAMLQVPALRYPGPSRTAVGRGGVSRAEPSRREGLLAARVPARGKATTLPPDGRETCGRRAWDP